MEQKVHAMDSDQSYTLCGRPIVTGTKFTDDGGELTCTDCFNLLEHPYGFIFHSEHVVDKEEAAENIRQSPEYRDRTQVKKLLAEANKQDDPVNHPSHYTSHPSGVECITIARHHDFNIGQVFKYIWRAGLKEDLALDALDKEIQDLEKGEFYLKDKIKMLKELRDGQKIN